MVLLPLVALICSMKISNYNVITTNLDSIFMVRAIHLAGLNLSLIIQTIFKKFYFYSWNGQREYLIAHLDSICWKPLPYNFFGAIGVTSGVDSIMWFSLDDMCMWFWEAAPIIPYTTGIVLDTHFRHQNKKSSIGFLFLCKGWYCIRLFSKWCESGRNEFQFFYIEFNDAWAKNHLHMSSSGNRNMLSIATGCPDCSKSFEKGFTNMLPQNQSDLLIDHSRHSSYCMIYPIEWKYSPEVKFCYFTNGKLTNFNHSRPSH